MRPHLLKILGVAALAASFTPLSHAIITGGAVTGGTALAAGGTFNILPVPLPNPFGTPNSVGNDTFQRPHLYGFNEEQNILLLSALSVDEVPGGGSGSIAAGTEVASHYIFFDPGPAQSQEGWVEFDSKILGVITSRGLLIASDVLANTGVNYLSPSARGLEGGDFAYISLVAGQENRLIVDWTASTPGDYVRVLTEHSPGAPVPEGGSTLALGGLAFALFAALARRRN